MESCAFQLSSSFTTTDRCSDRIAADAAPIRLSHPALRLPLAGEQDLEMLELLLHLRQGLSLWITCSFLGG